MQAVANSVWSQFFQSFALKRHVDLRSKSGDVDPIGTCPRKPRNYELEYKTRKLKEKLEEDNDQETRNPNKHTFQKTLDILNPTPNGNRLKNSKYRTQESINPLCQVVSSQEYKIASTLTK